MTECAPLPSKLYAIVDTATLGAFGVDALAFADACLRERPWALQLRAKDATKVDCAALARALRLRTRAANVTFVVNDDADLAAAVEADMVHVGQTDEAIGSIRARYPDLRMGVSTHTMSELTRALRAQVSLSYVAFGPVFSTASKRDPSPTVGVDGLAAAAPLARAHGVPLVAIGGIDETNVRTIRDHADAFAVIGTLAKAMRDGGAKNVRDQFARLCETIDGET